MYCVVLGHWGGSKSSCFSLARAVLYQSLSVLFQKQLEWKRPRKEEVLFTDIHFYELVRLLFVYDYNEATKLSRHRPDTPKKGEKTL